MLSTSQYKNYKPQFSKSEHTSIPFALIDTLNKENKENKENMKLKEKVNILTCMLISCKKEIQDMKDQLNNDNNDNSDNSDNNDNSDNKKEVNDDKDIKKLNFLLYFSSAAFLSAIYYYVFKK